MQVGITLPQMGPSAGPSALTDVAQAAEELGYHGVWVGDHIVLPHHYESEYPFSGNRAFPVAGAAPWLEAFSCLTYVAATTSRVRLGVSVCVVPYRNPVYLAKVVSTLDQLSQGRVTLGVGVGWLESEFEALGESFADRGRATDQALRLLRAAWGEEQPVAIPDTGQEMYFSPRPAQGAALPIWVGGGTGRRTFERVVSIGNAWHPHVIRLPPSDIGKHRETLMTLAESHGHDQPPQISLYAPVDLDPGAVSQEEPWVTGVLTTDPEGVRASLEEYARAGVDEFVLTMRGRAAVDVHEKIDAMRRLAECLWP